MDAIDLCNSSEESVVTSVSISLVQQKKNNELIPTTIFTNQSNENNRALSLEDSSLKNKKCKDIDADAYKKDSGDAECYRTGKTLMACKKQNIPEFANISKEISHQTLVGKRPREIQRANTNSALNRINVCIELLEDTDEEKSNVSFTHMDYSPRKKLFDDTQCTAATLDSTSSDSSRGSKEVLTSNDIGVTRDEVFGKPRPQLGISSDTVDLLSSDEEGVSDLSPQTSSMDRSSSLKELSNLETSVVKTQTLLNTSKHFSSVVVSRKKMKEVEFTSVRKSKNRSCSFASDSDSDDSSLLSPSCFAKSGKNPTKRLRSGQANSKTSKPVSNTVDLGHLSNDSSSRSSSCLDLKSKIAEQSRQEHTNVPKTTTDKSSLFDPLDSLMSPISIPHDRMIPQHSIAIPEENIILNTPKNNPKQQARCEKVPTPRIPIRGISGKLYPDLRHHFIKALLTHAKMTRRAIHERGVLDSSIRAVNIFSIYRFPIRTAEAGSRIKGIGHELLSVLRDAEKEKQPYNPPRGKFSSVAASALVVLLEHEEENPGNSLCSMEELITRINHLTHHNGSSFVLNRDASYYLDKNTLDPGWMQIKKLSSNNVYAGLEAMIKERRKKDACQSGIVYELLANGRETALQLKRTLEAGPVEAGPLRQLASDTVDKDFGNVTLSMDFREGGGSSKSLHKMCDLLDEYRVPYVVRNLKISDYVYFIGDKLAPVLIERKSVDDVACSLADGRWTRQQQNMRKAQYVLGNGTKRRCQICYLIEGDASKRIVHGGKVGRASWNCTLKNVEDAIAELPSLGFSVMKSRSHMGSMKILTQIARDVLWKYRNGSITCKYTYADFLKELKRCDSKEGDPPSLREHQYPAAPVVDSISLRLDPSTGVEMISNNIGIADIQDESSTHDAEQKANDLRKLSIASLKAMCKDRDEKVSGTKNELVERLLKKRKPEILITRSRRNQYTPKVPSCNAAIIVAILLNHIPGTDGLSKEKIMLLAEETGVSKDPMGGNGGWYDGWASVKEMISGDPPLICVSKRKYSLTTQPIGSSGLEVAKAIHIVAHRKNLCRCGQFVAI